MYVGETKFTMKKKMAQYLKDMKFWRTNNTIEKHAEKSGHKTDCL